MFFTIKTGGIEMKTSKKVGNPEGEKKKSSLSESYAIKCLKKNKMTYAFLLPAIVLVIVFCYLPLPGLYVAFTDYSAFKGIFGSDFVGLDNIIAILQTPKLFKAVLNTLYLSFLNIVIVFPIPIVFAIMINEIKNAAFKRIAQTISYLPHFISTIAVVGIASTIFSSSGIINDIRVALFGPETERILFLGLQEFFVPNIIGLTLWQSLGWSTIIFLSAISGIDPELYEAAIIDGAGKFKQCWYITLPSLSMTIILLLIFKIGSLLASNFDLIYGLQNVFIDFDVISTITYKEGIEAGNFGVSTALGFMTGVISMILTLGANAISKKINNVSLL